MKIHFIGIGGIGVSSLARYYLSEGWEVSGSDLNASEITEALEKQGTKIYIGEHAISNLKSEVFDLVVYSPAVRPENPELKEAKRLGIRCLSYPEALGELTKKYFTIAISGAHGKSTTTAMVSLVLMEAGFDPTVVIGTKLREFSAQGGLASGEGTNFRKGKSKYLVIEADEWGFSFLNYRPKIIILTNIDKEHLDCYKNLAHIFRTFKEYINHLPEDGILIANGDNKNVAKLVKSFKNPKFKIHKYSLKQKEATDIRKILNIPGEHNVSNSLGVLALAKTLAINDGVFYKGIAKYQGAWRRFETTKQKINNKEITLINDYGHHPSEIDATFKAARTKYPDKKIICVFQPHQYQRTFYLFKEFIGVFKKAKIDKIIITDIYDVAGRERKDIKKKISSEKLVKTVNLKKVIYLTKDKIQNFLGKEIQVGDIVLMMGAGDIYDFSKKIF
jgi:UDP-N-acetylmuramate--alanine ligase